MGQNLNIDRFLRCMSTNAVLGHRNTYGYISHKVYLYADAQDVVLGCLGWISWDHGLALTRGELNMTDPASGYTAVRGTLSRYLLDDDVHRAAYLQNATDFPSGSPFKQIAARHAHALTMLH